MAGTNEHPEYLTVKIGSAVRTLDEQKVGVVSELRGSYFKIKTGSLPGFLRHDFWLRTDSVRSAPSDEVVTLNVPKARLDDIKIVDVALL